MYMYVYVYTSCMADEGSAHTTACCCCFSGLHPTAPLPTPPPTFVHMQHALPGFITIVTMPMTYSIAYGE